MKMSPEEQIAHKIGKEIEKEAIRIIGTIPWEAPRNGSASVVKVETVIELLKDMINYEDIISKQKS